MADTELDRQAILSCESEPIRTPDAIQPHGCAFVCDVELQTITHVSSNVKAFFGWEPKQVLGKPVASLFQKELSHAIRNAASLRTISIQREYLGQFKFFWRNSEVLSKYGREAIGVIKSALMGNICY